MRARSDGSGRLGNVMVVGTIIPSEANDPLRITNNALRTHDSDLPFTTEGVSHHCDNHKACTGNHIVFAFDCYSTVFEIMFESVH